MAIRKYKPTTPGRRGSSVSDFAEITRSTPEKSLLRPLSKTGGRNGHGRITTRHKGGGHKRQYRVIDFRRNDKDGIAATVAHIEYDPNRTANIALLHYADGEKRYIIAPRNLKQGMRIESGATADIKVGNNLPLRNIPAGTMVHAVELRPGGGAKMARAAGAGIQLLGKDEVVWVDGGAVYHVCDSVSDIQTGSEKRTGTTAEAVEAGKSRLTLKFASELTACGLAVPQNADDIENALREIQGGAVDTLLPAPVWTNGEDAPPVIEDAPSEG